jgi:enediyne biosynthesis protein E4
MTRRFPYRLGPALAALLALACRPDAERTGRGDASTPSSPSDLRAPAAAPPDAAAEPLAEPSAEALFVESAAAVGLDFRHENGRTGRFRYSEMMGAGVALLDFDGDGDLDVYLVQGGPLEDPVEGPRPGDRLYRNELVETGRLSFVDVTEEAGIAATGYGMGALAADFDGDGWPDLYVTNLGADQLWRNRGDGTFEDATAAAGLDNPVWSVSAAALDFDRDGHLDLYVGNYLEYSVAGDKECTDELGARNYCGPLSFPPLPDRLWRNRGDGTFEDVSARAGITAAFGGALGVVADDFDGDGWPDLYVANDGTPNQLWINRGDGTFEDRALYAGCAVNGEGQAEAGMGVAVADVDFDHDLDFIVGHLDRETNTLYLNDGHGIFTDRSAISGLGAGSLDRTTFGLGWLDAELDGDLDLFVVNGAVKILKDLALAGDPWPLHQKDQLFLHEGDGRWNEVEGAGIGSCPKSAGARPSATWTTTATSTW